ncbi:MAG: tRNA (adenosine(37)-N6)-threonylcarbamoyltransferase complex dimerization subunit type 1 TsaB [Alphaproteobacteria bacterium]|nr:MAG: tRNA (adenosine(37)-N6)-threonylcarbamoyltransferase complex dimerization subunit type 1 TsaB [Alphaproteobacteria bacterium]
MLTLAIDTSAHLCAAALHDDADDTILAEVSDDIGRGHAERLMDIVADTLAAGDRTYADLGRIAACAGPGSFTGVRVGLATARGMALGLGVAAVGVSALEALAAEAGVTGHETLLALIDARRGEAYAQFFGTVPPGLPQGPFVAGYPAIATMAAQPGCLALCGAGAPALVGETKLQAAILHRLAAAPAARYARLGAAAVPAGRPEPLYLRPPDAKPQIGFAVSRA